MRDAPDVAGEAPDEQERDPAAHDQRQPERPIFNEDVLGEQKGEVGWFEPGEGGLSFRGGDFRALVFAGEPIEEPVVAYGPFVMNTRQEIVQAFEDYQAGRLVAQE